MKLPQLAIFDMDGLIFDTERLMKEENAKVLAEYGYQQDMEKYMYTMGTAGATLMKRARENYGEDFPAEEVYQKTEDRCRARVLREGPPIKEGIPELLAFFLEQGVTCCVASSTQSSTVATFLKMANLSQFFAFQICGDQISHSKPNPEIFQKCLTQNGTDPGDAVVFEDSENGIRAAVNAGIPGICILDMKVPCEEVATQTAAILESAKEAISLFSNER